MGIFLSLCCAIGKTEQQLVQCIEQYANQHHQSFVQTSQSAAQQQYCVVSSAFGNTSILWNDSFTEWDEAAEFVSASLGCSTFSFHIHDGDFWMYTLFTDGKVIDQFNPVPHYFENLSETELALWKGDAALLEKHTSIPATHFEKYLVEWNDSMDDQKAYLDDDCCYHEDWQLVDFMNKLKLPFPYEDQYDNQQKGTFYSFVDKQLIVTQSGELQSAETLMDETIHHHTQSDHTEVHQQLVSEMNIDFSENTSNAVSEISATAVPQEPIKVKKPWWKFW
jgi:hypothetical protein